jgi:hypothetical protein
VAEDKYNFIGIPPQGNSIGILWCTNPKIVIVINELIFIVSERLDELFHKGREWGKRVLSFEF